MSSRKSELFGGCGHTTVLHSVHRITCVYKECRSLGFRRQGAATQQVGQCRGRTHIPMPLESNPGGAALHSDCTKRANKLAVSAWPTKRALDNSNVTVMRVLGLQAGQRFQKAYRPGVSGFAIAEESRKRGMES